MKMVRPTPALFLDTILVAQSGKLQPAKGGLNVLLSVALQIKMRLANTTTLQKLKFY
jgi:hypothetical protein